MEIVRLFGTDDCQPVFSANPTLSSSSTNHRQANNRDSQLLDDRKSAKSTNGRSCQREDPFNGDNYRSSVADCVRRSFLEESHDTIISCQLDLSDMSTSLQSVNMVKEWSSAPKTTIVGERPASDVRPNTYTRESRFGDVRTITPLYKPSIPNGDVAHSTTHQQIPKPFNVNGHTDYREERQQEHYRLQMLEPKVDSHFNIPVHASTLPKKKPTARDFPSTHSKRSFLKLDPMEQRKVKSVEVRPITTTDYLTESIERHRDMVVSPLKDYLKLKEREVNKPWDKPNRPGHREGDPLEGLLYKSELTMTKEPLFDFQLPNDHELVISAKQDLQNTSQKVIRSGSFELYGRQPMTDDELFYPVLSLFHSHSLDSLPSLSSVSPKSLRKSSLLSWHRRSCQGSVKRKIRSHLARNAQQRFDPVIYEPQKVIFENEPKCSGAISEKTAIRLPQERIVYENTPEPHNTVGHFTSNRFGMPTPHTVYENEPKSIEVDARYHYDPYIKPDLIASYDTMDWTTQKDYGSNSNEFGSQPISAPQFVSAVALRPGLEDNNSDGAILYKQQSVTTDYSFAHTNFPPNRLVGSGQSAPAPPPKPKLSRDRLDYQKPIYNNSVNTNYDETVVTWPPQQDAAILRSTRVPKSMPRDENYTRRLQEQRIREQEMLRRRQEEFLDQRRRQEERLEQERRMLMQQQMQRQHIHTPNQSQSLSLPGPQENSVTLPNRSSAETVLSPGGTSWRRSYPVQIPPPQEVVKNKIVTSDDLLDEDSYYVDILARRDAFVERAQPPPDVYRMGRKWQPPPEKPYKWPQRHSWRHFHSDDFGSHKWVPQTFEPEFKYERKNFTPESSPIGERSQSPLPGTLDYLNQRQLRGMIMPSSYRRSMTPMTGDRSPMQVRLRVLPHDQAHSITPSDVTLSTTELPSPPLIPYHIKPNEMFNDKIYDLLPHSSTVTGRDVPSNTGVSRKIVALEGGRSSKQSSKRATSTLPTHPETPPVSVQRSTSATMPTQIPTYRANHNHYNTATTNHVSPQRHYFGRVPSVTIPTPPPQMEPPKRTAELEELSILRARLEQKAKERHVDLKLSKPDIQKEDPEFEPHPQIPVKERVRVQERLESRLSNFTTSSTPIKDTSGDVTDVSTTTWQFSNNSAFSPRSIISINGHSKEDSGLLKVRTDLSPLTQTVHRSNAGVQTTTLEQTANQPLQYMQAVLVPISNAAGASSLTRHEERKFDRFSSMPALDYDNTTGRSTLVEIKDERARKPHSIMKQRRELESKDAMLYPSKSERNIRRWTNESVKAPAARESVEKVEETKRTEEIERTVKSKEKKHKKHRDRSSSRHKGQSYATYGGVQQGQIDNPPWTLPIGYHSQNSSRRNSGMIQNGYGTYQPQISEGYVKQTSTRRMRDHSMDSNFNRSGRQGSLSDSLRRGDLRYIPNGEIRERRQGSRPSSVHKSLSHRDIYHNVPMYDEYGYQTHDSRRGPIIEYPPTLPRDAPMPPPHRNLGVHKSRSFADWEDDRRSRDWAMENQNPKSRDWTVAMGRFQNDMSKLERDFHDSLLMPMPSGKVNDKDYKQDKVPGGMESLSKEYKADTGIRNNPNDPNSRTHFNEAKQEMHYKRDTVGRR